MNSLNTVKTRRIKLEAPNHINKHLTHWTGRGKDCKKAFEIQCKILETSELRFGICKTSFPASVMTAHDTMVCFTDTPIEQALTHCKRYNFFGISFNKSAMIEYGANPILYLADNRAVHQESILEYTIREKYDLLMNWFGSVTQPFNIIGDEHGSYFQEREWRIIRRLPHGFQVNEDIKENKFPFKGAIRKEQDMAQPSEPTFYLPFDMSVIENVIVPSDYAEVASQFLHSHGYSCELIVIEKPI